MTSTTIHVSPTQVSAAAARGVGWLSRLSFALLVLLAAVSGVLLSDALFARNNHFSVWFAVKPGLLVDLVDETGVLEIAPFRDAQQWYHRSANTESLRWGSTLNFTALHQVTGQSMASLSTAPWGTAVIVLAMGFLVRAAGLRGPGALRWAFLLTAALFLFNWPLWGWTSHSGGWPASSVFLLMVGALFMAIGREWEQPWVALVLALGLLVYGLYSAMLVVVAVLFATLALYSLAVAFLSRSRGTTPRGLRPGLFLSLAGVFSVMLGSDYIFTSLLATYRSLFLDPWVSFLNIFTFFLRGGVYGPYFIGYPALEKVMYLLPMAGFLVVGGGLWLADQALPLLRGGRLTSSQVLAGGVFLTTASLLVLGALPGGLRITEAYFVALFGMSLLLAQHPSAGGATGRPSGVRPAIAIALGAALVVVSLVSFMVLVRAPISKVSYLTQAEVAGAQWAGRNVDMPYFADTVATGIALLSNARTPIVDTAVRLQYSREAVALLYSGERGLVGALQGAGADGALLSQRNLEPDAPEPVQHALTLPDFIARPLPRYDFAGAPFHMLYSNGETIFVSFAGSAEGAEGETTQVEASGDGPRK